MANELKHGSQGTELTQGEFEGVGLHVFNSQATGDIVYASSSSQLTRLGKATDGDVLTLASGIPSWATPTVGDITGVTAGTGLTGGGTTGTVTVNLALTGLVDTAIANGDFIVFTDTTDSNATVKGDLADIATLFAGTGLTALNSVIGVDAAQTGITSLGTQAANLAVGNGYGVVIGTATQETVSIGDGATDLVPELQVLGTTAADSSLLLAAFSTTATTAGSPIIALAKGGHGTLGSHTVVTDGEELGNIIAFGDDGTDLESPAASIQFEVDGTPGAGDMPGRILLNTTADGATAVTEAVRIDSSQNTTFAGNITIADDKDVTLGEAGKIDFGDTAPDDNEATGMIFSFTAGATLAIGDVVYMHTDGEVAKTDASAVGTMPAIGICVSSGSDGAAVDVMVQGVMHDTSAFPTFTIGNDLFVSTTAGLVAAAAPSGSGDTVQKIGVATHADKAYFNFNTTEILLA